MLLPTDGEPESAPSVAMAASDSMIEALADAVRSAVYDAAPLQLGLDPLRAWLVRGSSSNWLRLSAAARVKQLVHLRRVAIELNFPAGAHLRDRIDAMGAAVQRDVSAHLVALASSAPPKRRAPAIAMGLLTRRELYARGWTAALERRFAPASCRGQCAVRVVYEREQVETIEASAEFQQALATSARAAAVRADASAATVRIKVMLPMIDLDSVIARVVADYNNPMRYRCPRDRDLSYDEIGIAHYLLALDALTNEAKVTVDDCGFRHAYEVAALSRPDYARRELRSLLETRVRAAICTAHPRLVEAAQLVAQSSRRASELVELVRPLCDRFDWDNLEQYKLLVRYRG